MENKKIKKNNKHKSMNQMKNRNIKQCKNNPALMSFQKDLTIPRYGQNIKTVHDHQIRKY